MFSPTIIFKIYYLYSEYMETCPKCKRKLKKVFHGEPDDELAIEAMNNEIIIGNCCESNYNYYCEYCDEFFMI